MTTAAGVRVRRLNAPFPERPAAPRAAGCPPAAAAGENPIAAERAELILDRYTNMIHKYLFFGIPRAGRAGQTSPPTLRAGKNLIFFLFNVPFRRAAARPSTATAFPRRFLARTLVAQTMDDIKYRTLQQCLKRCHLKASGNRRELTCRLVAGLLKRSAAGQPEYGELEQVVGFLLTDEMLLAEAATFDDDDHAREPDLADAVAAIRQATAGGGSSPQRATEGAAASADSSSDAANDGDALSAGEARCPAPVAVSTASTPAGAARHVGTPMNTPADAAVQAPRVATSMRLQAACNALKTITERANEDDEVGRITSARTASAKVSKTASTGGKARRKRPFSVHKSNKEPTQFKEFNLSCYRGGKKVKASAEKSAFRPYKGALPRMPMGTPAAEIFNRENALGGDSASRSGRRGQRSAQR